jgi:hypothetical protein
VNPSGGWEHLVWVVLVDGGADRVGSMKRKHAAVSGERWRDKGPS